MMETFLKCPALVLGSEAPTRTWALGTRVPTAPHTRLEAKKETGPTAHRPQGTPRKLLSGLSFAAVRLFPVKAEVGGIKRKRTLTLSEG